MVAPNKGPGICSATYRRPRASMLAGARFVAADYAGSGAIFWSDGIRLVQANNTPSPVAQ